MKSSSPCPTASLRIELLINGRRIAVAGLEGFGVLTAIVDLVRRSPDAITPKMRAKASFDERRFLEEVCEVALGGLDSVTGEDLFWAKEALGPGAEVTIRVLGAGEYDPPCLDPDE